MVHELIRKRYSPRAFSNKLIEEEKIIELFEAARWAPSARNEQPWRFISADIRNENDHKNMVEILFEKNQVWAKNTPLLILVIAKTNLDYNGNLNSHAFHDVGLAVANLIFQATASDLYAHQMGGFDRSKAKELFEIPEGYEPVSVIAIGYIGNSNLLSESLRMLEKTPRNRKNIEEIAFKGKFGKSLKFQYEKEFDEVK